MTINLDLTSPINIVRAMVGDVDINNPIMSDNMYQQIIDINTVNGRSECVIVWFSALQAAGYLMAQYAPEGMRYRERVNAVEFEQYGGERYKSYVRLNDWLKRNPPNTCSIGSALFHFGGTYTECSQIYTMKYINDCLGQCWNLVWKDGYLASCGC